MDKHRHIKQTHSVLKTLFDNSDIAFISAVTLSYLQEAEQSLLAELLGQSSFAVDMKRADMLRKQSGKLDDRRVHDILSGKAKPTPNRTATVRVSRATYAKYFMLSQSAQEIQRIVEAALDLYFAEK